MASVHNHTRKTQSVAIADIFQGEQPARTPTLLLAPRGPRLFRRLDLCGEHTDVQWAGELVLINVLTVGLVTLNEVFSSASEAVDSTETDQDHFGYHLARELPRRTSTHVISSMMVRQQPPIWRLHHTPSRQPAQPPSSPMMLRHPPTRNHCRRGDKGRCRSAGTNWGTTLRTVRPGTAFSVFTGSKGSHRYRRVLSLRSISLHGNAVSLHLLLVEYAVSAYLPKANSLTLGGKPIGIPTGAEQVTTSSWRVWAARISPARRHASGRGKWAVGD